MNKFISSGIAHVVRFQNEIALTYARLWFAGKSPLAPGTCGSFMAICLAPVLFTPLSGWGRLLFLALITGTGIWASGRAAALLGRKDPSEVVVDELLGQWVTCLPFWDIALGEYLLLFALFRLFDITKPWPIKILERYPAGIGIMVDDAAAGVYAALCFWGIRSLYL